VSADRVDSIAAGRTLVDGDRQADYGDSGSMMANVARAWSGVLGYTITPKQVALCMAALKLVRENYRAKADNQADAQGYILIAERIEHAGWTATASLAAGPATAP